MRTDGEEPSERCMVARVESMAGSRRRDRPAERAMLPSHMTRSLGINGVQARSKPAETTSRSIHHPGVRTTIVENLSRNSANIKFG